jgi:uncharacterized protein with NRDE domain
MCTLAIYHRLFPGLPVVVAANRDEFLARPTRDPYLLVDSPRVFGGQDEVAGGSWLTLSESGLVVGVLNRRVTLPAGGARESRGHLCLDLARLPDAATAAEFLKRVPADQHNPFNILVADSRKAFVAQNRSTSTHVVELDPGLHVLTNLDVNDHECSRISHSWKFFSEAGESFLEHGDQEHLRADLRAVLSDHLTAVDDRQPTDQLCIHTEGYGTRSSSMVVLDDAGGAAFHHAAGPPCRTEYERLFVG